MKKLLILALSAASLFCVCGESLYDAIDKVEKMIKRYEPGSRASKSAFHDLDAILESQEPNDKKIAALHKRFPDVFKENLIVKEPVLWKVHSLSLGYDIKDSSSKTIKTVKIIEELRKKDASSEESKKDDSGKNTAGKTETDVSVEGTVSSNPLQWGLQAKGSISGHFEASYSKRQETSSLWNKKDQQMFQHHRETIRTQIYQANIQNLHLAFTVTLFNQTDSPLTFSPRDASIPVYMGSRSCNKKAVPFEQQEHLVLRSFNEQGQDVVFRMELDTTSARELVDFMSVSAPQIPLERGIIRIVNSNGEDMLSTMRNAPPSAPVLLSTPRGSFSWRLRIYHDRGGEVTIGEACDAIAQDVKRFKDPLFKEDGKGGLASVSDVPFGPSERLGWTAFLEYGGRIYSEVPADVLEKPVGHDGFTFHVVDLNDPKNIKDPKLQEAITKHYRKAAENGDAKAQFLLGKCYYHGWGVEKDLKQAVFWVRKAADQGYADAQCGLGFCYYHGQGVEKDPKQAVYWFRKAADQGNAGAQCGLGFCYYHGQGVEKDPKQAVYWYRKAAEQGNAVAQFRLGLCFHSAGGVKKDLKQAAYWYRKAAEQGNAGAQFALGNLYEFGEGVEKDLEEAFSWYRKAAEQGVAEAQFALGVFYEFGKGVEKNLTLAVFWYRKAAEQGHMRAQNNLGFCYEKGQGVKKDLKEAVKWYRKSAEQGASEAQNNLGLCYKKGEGVEKDLQEAAEWFRKAAEQGHMSAQNNLGCCYEKGEGVEKDLKEAVKWFRKAAEQGFAEAQYNLGICYEYGYIDVPMKTRENEAIAWYRRAAAQGHDGARLALKRLQIK